MIDTLISGPLALGLWGSGVGYVNPLQQSGAGYANVENSVGQNVKNTASGELFSTCYGTMST